MGIHRPRRVEGERQRGPTPAPDTEIVTPAWHALSDAEVLARTGSTREGLTHGQAQQRLQVSGPNALPLSPVPTWPAIALRQLRSPLIYILLVAALVSVVLRDFTDAAFIAAARLAVQSSQMCQSSDRLGFFPPQTLHLPRHVIFGSSFGALVAIRVLLRSCSCERNYLSRRSSTAP